MTAQIQKNTDFTRLEDAQLAAVNVLRAQFESSDAMKHIRLPMALEDVILKGNQIRTILSSEGINPNHGDLGHAIGHVGRDKVHGWMLCHNRHVPDSALIPTYLAAEHHDAGSFLVDRYSEDRRAVRHAEVGGLKVYEALMESGFDEMTALKVAYGIFAHTHYLAERKVVCFDGVERITKPYLDQTHEGTPLLFVSTPRAVDRLDCTNPAFIIRHLISKFDIVKGRKDHADFDGKDFFAINFAHHMTVQNRPPEIYRASKDTPQNAIEHVQMFIDSQNPSTSYAKSDDGFIRFLIATNCERNQRVIDALLNPKKLSDAQRSTQFQRFVDMVAYNIEPTAMGGEGAQAIVSAIQSLGDEECNAWAYGIQMIAHEYKQWAIPYVQFLEKQSKELRTLDPWHTDVLDIIKPHESWA